MPSSLPSRSSRTAVSSAACAADPLDRSTGTCPTPVKNIFLSRPMQPGLGEVLPLGQERDAARHQQRQEERVGDGEVVAGEDRATVLRDVLEPLDRRPAANRRISGPSSTYFDHQYSTGRRTPHVDGDQPTETLFPQPQRAGACQDGGDRMRSAAARTGGPRDP